MKKYLVIGTGLIVVVFLVVEYHFLLNPFYWRCSNIKMGATENEAHSAMEAYSAYLEKKDSYLIYSLVDRACVIELKDGVVTSAWTQKTPF